MKKLFTILVLFSLVFSMVPKDAFCDDHHQKQEASTHEHCSILCHACFSVVVPVESSFTLAVETSTTNFFQVVSYTNPTIARLKRPPIQIS